MPAQKIQSEEREKRAPALVSVDGRTYPLRSAEVRARAEGGFARTILTQEFTNPYEQPLEVLYTMPLPADGAVLGYTVRMGQRIIRGEIERREEAAARYRDALYDGKVAGLLEESRSDTFHQSLGNLPPHTDVRVEIEVIHPLSFLPAAGSLVPLWEYRFPTVVGVRYEGAPGRTPDADRLGADRAEEGTPARVELFLTVSDVMEGTGGVTSTTHDIVAETTPDGVGVKLCHGARLDRDLVLRWAAAVGEVGVRVVEGSGLAPDNGRYALVTITPPGAARTSYARDLTVLIDASGSMLGEPIALAKAIVGDLLATLESGDRFEVWQFAGMPSHVSHGFEQATPKSIERCIRDVNQIQAGGGTEMLEALEQALTALRPESQRQIVLVTDGQIGFEAELCSTMRDRLPTGVRVHVVGIGSVPNRALTSSMARVGRGIELIVEDHAIVAETARRLRAATVRPQLMDIRVGGSALRGAAPARPRDVFAGQPLVLATEFHAEGGTFEVCGNLAGSKELWIWRIAIPASGEAQNRLGSTSLPIGAVYGRERILDLDLTRGAWGGSPALDSEIEEIAMRHRIVSRLTSLVAIAEEPSVDPHEPRRRTKLALELPSGVSAAGVGLRPAGYRSMPTGTFFLERSAVPPMASRVKAWSLVDFGDFLRRSSRLKATPMEIGKGTALAIDGPRLTLELTSPWDGFLLPRGLIRALVNGRAIKARVVKERSTAPGPHQAGVLVKLCIRLAGAGWPDAGRAEVAWDHPASFGVPGKVELVLSIELPARSGRMIEP